MFNKKYTYGGLDIELTRKCNKKCKHCLRGDAQNITITKEIIDTIIEDVGDCASLYISGGEPLLETEMLFYLLEQVAEHWNTFAVEITSNGSVLDTRVVDALEQFCNTPTGSPKSVRKVQLTISSDSYHTFGDCQKALDFYGPLFENANKRLGCSEDDKQLILETWSPIDAKQHEEKGGKPILIYAGRGIDLAKNDYSYISKKSLKIPGSNYHRLKIINNYVYCMIKITAQGNVTLAREDDSFEADDSKASGNILNNKLTDIIDQHQESCLITCAEVNMVNSEQTRVVYGKNGFRFEEELSQHFLYLVFTMILKAREAAKALYPLLSASDIILGLPMPQSQQEACDYAKQIFDRIPSDITLTLDDYDLKRFDARKRRMSKTEQDFCLWMMTDIAYANEYEPDFFNLIASLLVAKLDALDKKAKLYQTRIYFPDNGHVFACGSNDIFECQDTRDMRYVE